MRLPDMGGTNTVLITCKFRSRTRCEVECLRPLSQSRLLPPPASFPDGAGLRHQAALMHFGIVLYSNFRRTGLDLLQSHMNIATLKIRRGRRSGFICSVETALPSRLWLPCIYFRIRTSHSVADRVILVDIGR